MKAWQRRVNDIPQRIGNSREAESFCLSLTAGSRNESFWVVCLNAKCDVLGKRRISEGSLSEVSAYPRIVMETALVLSLDTTVHDISFPGSGSKALMPGAPSSSPSQDLESFIEDPL